MKTIITVLFLSITISVNCQQSTLENHYKESDTTKPIYIEGGRYKIATVQDLPKYSFNPNLMKNKFEAKYYLQIATVIYYVTPKDSIVVVDSIKFHKLIKYVK